MKKTDTKTHKTKKHFSVPSSTPLSVVLASKVFYFFAWLSTFWIFSKKLRRLTRRKLYTTLQMIVLRAKYPNSIFLLSRVGIGFGEFIMAVSLLKAVKEKTKKNIVIVTKKVSETDICKVYNKTVSCCYLPNCNNMIPTPDIPEKPCVGKLYSLYVRLVETSNIVRHDLEIQYIKDFFHIDLQTAPQTVIPLRPKVAASHLAKIERFMKKNKTILIFPDANTYDSSVISPSDWEMIGNQLKAVCRGGVIFNAKYRIEGFDNIFFPLEHTLYLASLASGIVTFRSGLSELLAVTTKAPMVVIYPDGKTHLFQKEKMMSIQEFKNNTIKIFPWVLNDAQDITLQTYKWNSISKNYNRDDCKDFYYDNNPAQLANFTIEMFSQK